MDPKYYIKHRIIYLLYSNMLIYTSFYILTIIGLLKGYNQFSTKITNAYVYVLSSHYKTYLKPNVTLKEFYEQVYKIKLGDDKVHLIIFMLKDYSKISVVYDKFRTKIL